MDEVIEIQVLDTEGITHTLNCTEREGLTLKDLCKMYELPLESVCDGMMLCATCHCYIVDGIESLAMKSDMEEALLSELFTANENSRLACQIPITAEMNGLKIKIAPI